MGVSRQRQASLGKFCSFLDVFRCFDKLAFTRDGLNSGKVSGKKLHCIYFATSADVKLIYFPVIIIFFFFLDVTFLFCFTVLLCFCVCMCVLLCNFTFT